MSWPAVRRHASILGLVTACAVIARQPSAFADGLIGKHFFPSTLAIDDPFIADELGFRLLHIKAPGRGQSPPTLTTAIDAVYAKRLTESLGLSVGGRLLHLDPDDRSSQTGFDNATVELKYEIADSAEHEALLSAALGWEIGGTGDASVGVPSFDVVAPAVFFAKGFGDLPEALLFARPFALTGRVGATIPTRGSSRTFDPALATRTVHENPKVLEWGVAMEYSLPYLQDVVPGVALPPPFSRMVPLVEFSLATPLDGADRGRTFGTVNPGIAWLASGNRFQLALEAAIAVNNRTGKTIGVRASLNIFLNRMFPTSRLFRPLF